MLSLDFLSSSTIISSTLGSNEFKHRSIMSSALHTIMQALNSDERDKLVKGFISPITTVNENVKIERVFRSMKASKKHMYLVHHKDDSENIIGLVTLEDILEEIVGEIEDETDHIHEGVVK